MKHMHCNCMILTQIAVGGGGCYALLSVTAKDR